MSARLGARLAQSSRSYATAASTKPPIALFGIDGRYASALYTAAAQKKALETVEKELKDAKANLEKDAKLRAFLENPTIQAADRKLGIQQLLKGKNSDLTKNFFETLSEMGRLSETSKIIESYFQLMQAYRGETPVTITSVEALDKSTMDKLTSLLNKSSLASSGKTLKISNKVDPSIVGGLVVEFGDNTIDLSVSSKITRLNKLLTDSV